MTIPDTQKCVALNGKSHVGTHFLQYYIIKYILSQADGTIFQSKKQEKALKSENCPKNFGL